jgi:iron(III) transport system substrate-binding protein
MSATASMNTSRLNARLRDVSRGLLALAVGSAMGFASATQANETVRPGPMLMAQAPKPPAPNPQAAAAALDALIKAAKAEGELTYYSAQTENVPRRVSAAFQAKYGINAKFVRFNSILLQQRFSTDAETGNFAADMIINSGDSVTYAEAGIKKGWFEPLATAGVPVVLSGEFPARFNRGVTAIIQLSPWGIAYNSDKVKGADIPKDWPDLLNPKWKGQILLPDPRASDAYIDQWAMIFDKYGESFFAKFREQAPRLYASGVPATQALGAGEGMIQVPTVGPQVQGVKDKGAPVAMMIPEMAVGVEQHVTLTLRTKAKNPNAARLFANYVMSPEGNQVFNADPGQAPVYALGTSLPKDYRSPIPGTAGRKAEIIKLFGL